METWQSSSVGDAKRNFFLFLSRVTHVFHFEAKTGWIYTANRAHGCCTTKLLPGHTAPPKHVRQVSRGEKAVLSLAWGWHRVGAQQIRVERTNKQVHVCMCVLVLPWPTNNQKPSVGEEFLMECDWKWKAPILCSWPNVRCSWPRCLLSGGRPALGRWVSLLVSSRNPVCRHCVLLIPRNNPGWSSSCH